MVFFIDHDLKNKRKVITAMYYKVKRAKRESILSIHLSKCIIIKLLQRQSRTHNKHLNHCYFALMKIET